MDFSSMPTSPPFPPITTYDIVTIGPNNEIIVEGTITVNNEETQNSE